MSLRRPALALLALLATGIGPRAEPARGAARPDAASAAPSARIGVRSEPGRVAARPEAPSGPSRLTDPVRELGAGWPVVVGAAEVFYRDAVTGLALGGYDPVTYFLPGGPRPGRPEFEWVWGGVAWRFASAANLAAFRADPATFSPRLGGYDGEGMSRGRVVDADPLLYTVRDGRRLYLFRTHAGRSAFLEDASLASKGEENWVRLRSGLVQP